MADPGGPKSWKSGLAMVSAGFVMVACTALGLMLGLWLDKEFESEPWLMVGGIVLGATAGFVQFLRAVGRANG